MTPYGADELLLSAPILYTDKEAMRPLDDIGTVDHAIFDAAPVGTYDDIATFLTDGYWTWSSRAPRQFNVSSGDTLTVNISALTTDAQALALEALQFWTDVSGLQFSETTGVADITFDDSDSGAYSTSVTSGGYITSSFVNVTESWNSYSTSIVGYTFQTYIHEIGHALGLGHAGYYNGSASYPSDAAFENDSWQSSIMSYFSQTENSTVDADYAFVLTPMIADIIAIQSLYGTPSATRNGDTTYGNNSNAGSIYDADVYSTAEYYYYGISFTIYDTGGTDTMDYSGFAADQVIDLNAEGISSVMGWEGNVLIARGVTIENAIGGSGDDSLSGNDAANTLEGNEGDDTLEGGGNDDTLFGGDGFDIAAFSGHSSEYTITDNLDGSYTVDHTSGSGSDATDLLWGMEAARFSNKQVALNPITGSLDVVFLQDLTGSFYDDLPIMQEIVDDVGFAIRNEFNGSRFAVTSFKDESDDYTYRVEADFTQVPASIASTYSTLVASGGGDSPEAQLTALAEAAAGAGLSYRSDVTKLFILSTDAGYHTYEDIPTLKSTFEANDIIPVFTVTSGYVSTYEDLVNQLGRGVVVQISYDSEDFLDGIRFAIANLAGEVTDAGDTYNNTLIGIDGFEDAIYGLGGNDTISGGSGQDLLDGGADDDYLMGGDDEDHLIGGTGDDYIDGQAQTDSLEGGTGNDTLIGGRGFDNLSGNEDNDVLYGWAGRDQLYGGSGDDTLDGGADGDDLYGRSGTDTVSYMSSDAGVIVNLTANTATGGHADGDVIDSFESAIGSDFDDTLTGTDGINELIGLDGDDRLNGLTGSDALDAGAGNDTVYGGKGWDAILGRAGDDWINSGDGNDSIDAGGGDDYVLTGIGNDDVYGGDGLDTIFGDDGDDILRGNAGDDALRGNQGDDMMFGGIGNDDLSAGYGDDDLDGAEGDDVLAGRDGVDLIMGGSGNDVAVFSGNASDYTLFEGRGVIYVVDMRGGSPDGLDILDSIETYRFSDGDVSAAAAAERISAEPADMQDLLAGLGLSAESLDAVLEARLDALEARLGERSGSMKSLYERFQNDESQTPPDQTPTGSTDDNSIADFSEMSALLAEQFGAEFNFSDYGL